MWQVKVWQVKVSEWSKILPDIKLNLEFKAEVDKNISKFITTFICQIYFKPFHI